LKEMGYVASMLQTGGMNHAGSIEKVDGGYYQFTYNFDGDHVKMDMLVKDNKNIIKYYLEAKMLFSFERSRVCR